MGMGGHNAINSSSQFVSSEIVRHETTHSKSIEGKLLKAQTANPQGLAIHVISNFCGFPIRNEQSVEVMTLGL